MENCFVCEIIEKIKNGSNPYFVKELKTGYVVLANLQRFEGYTIFICKEHVTELHQLESNYKKDFLNEMSLVAEAVYNAFNPDKLNYELLGVGKGEHMHWHIIPRREGDTPKHGPIWKMEKEELNDPSYKPSDNELEDLKYKLLTELDKVLANNWV